MVEYIKSSGGYFYKVYKNGEKKRISKEDYFKHIKKIGKGSSLSVPQKDLEYISKSKEDILKELKKKGKYEEWKQKGSYYGWLLSRNSNESYVTYKNLNGDNVKVTNVLKEFDPKEHNVAVFDFVLEVPSYVSYATFVPQGTFNIVENNNTPDLYTYGLASCSALVMDIGNKKFMAHLDAETNIIPIKNAIQETITKQKIDIKNIYPTIYEGSLYSENAVEKAKNICKQLNIPIDNIQYDDVSLMTYVSI